MNKKKLIIILLALCLCTCVIVLILILVNNNRNEGLLKASEDINKNFYANFCSKGPSLRSSDFDNSFSKRYKRFKDLNDFQKNEADLIFDSQGCIGQLPTTISQIKGTFVSDYNKDLSDLNFYELSYDAKNGIQSVRMTIFFVYEDGGWKIDHITQYLSVNCPNCY